MLYATVRQRKIHVKNPVTVIQNGVNVDELLLDMDDEWRDMTSIVAVFTLKYSEIEKVEEKEQTVSKELAKEMLHIFGEPIMVPWECLQHTGKLSVSCTGYVGSEKVMTTMLPDSFWNVVQNGAMKGEETAEPTPSLYEQVLSMAVAAGEAATAATAVSNQLLQDKANGVFDGADGRGILSIASTSDGAWTIHYTDGSSEIIDNAAYQSLMRAANAAANSANTAANSANNAAHGANNAADNANDAASAANAAAQSASRAEEELRKAAENGEFDGAPLTYDMLTPEQKEELKGGKGDPFTYDDFTPEQLDDLERGAKAAQAAAEAAAKAAQAAAEKAKEEAEGIAGGDFATKTELKDYLPLAGGTMQGQLVFNGGDSDGGSKIVLETGKGQITNSGTQTLFGFTSSQVLSIGHGSYALNIRANSRPTINNSPIALKDEIPTVPILTTETWTFTLEDGSTVTKAVYVG